MLNSGVFSLRRSGAQASSQALGRRPLRSSAASVFGLLGLRPFWFSIGHSRGGLLRFSFAPNLRRSSPRTLWRLLLLWCPHRVNSYSLGLHQGLAVSTVQPPMRSASLCTWQLRNALTLALRCSPALHHLLCSATRHTSGVSDHPLWRPVAPASWRSAQSLWHSAPSSARSVTALGGSSALGQLLRSMLSGARPL